MLVFSTQIPWFQRKFQTVQCLFVVWTKPNIGPRNLACDQSECQSSSAPVSQSLKRCHFSSANFEAFCIYADLSSVSASFWLKSSKPAHLASMLVVHLEWRIGVQARSEECASKKCFKKMCMSSCVSRSRIAVVHHSVPLGVVLCHNVWWRRDGHVHVVISAIQSCWSFAEPSLQYSVSTKVANQANTSIKVNQSCLHGS